MNYIDDYFKQLVNHLKKKTKEEKKDENLGKTGETPEPTE